MRLAKAALPDDGKLLLGDAVQYGHGVSAAAAAHRAGVVGTAAVIQVVSLCSFYGKGNSSRLDMGVIGLNGIQAHVYKFADVIGKVGGLLL